MKIRNGFVSNSSSSSFVITIKKTDYENGFVRIPIKKLGSLISSKEDYTTMLGVDIDGISDKEWNNFTSKVEANEVMLFTDIDNNSYALLDMVDGANIIKDMED